MGRHSLSRQSKGRRPLRRATAMSVGAGVGLSTLLLGPIAQAATGSPQGAGAALVEGTPCTVTAAACVDLASRKAWLIEDGAVVRGAVPIMPGEPENPTPVGTFHVEWKNPQHVNAKGQPMPYSVFFADGGVAFHEGSLERYSVGCVHLAHDDAVAFYDALQVGDEVQVH